MVCTWFEPALCSSPSLVEEHSSVSHSVWKGRGARTAIPQEREVHGDG